MMYYVYALMDPISNIPFYIGKGCRNRAYQHLNGQENSNKKKLKYIENIRSLGFEPFVYFIEQNIIDETFAYDLEDYIMNQCKIYFPFLTNINYNGRVPSRLGVRDSPETRKRKSDAQIGSPATRTYFVSEETKEKISKSLKGRKGRKWSEEDKLKHSLKFKGKKKSRHKK